MIKHSVIAIIIIVQTLFLVVLCRAADPVIWDLTNLDSIGGHVVTVYGNPKIIDTGTGKALEFDGIDDGILINNNPLNNADAFTIEVVFKPYSGGLTEQRFVHIQQDENNRVLVELRSTPSNQWYIDTFIKSGTASKTLVDEKKLHVNNVWHSVALVYENKKMRHYIDGVLELEGDVAYAKQTKGSTSIGVRQNKVSWYKGAIKTVRISHNALQPSDMLKGETTAAPTLQLQADPDTFLLNGVYTRTKGNTAIADITLNRPGNVTIEAISINGQRFSLIDNKTIEAGTHQLTFNTQALSSGIYTVVITMNGVTRSQRIQIDR